MRSTFTLITFLLVTSLGWTQTILFQDTFEDDKNKWTFNGDGFDSKVDDGKLILENKILKNYVQK